MQLTRETPDPLYMQVKAALLTDIAAGRYQPHMRLPSERELCDTFQVSRMTIRQALTDLARSGAIYTRVGKGTFVAEAKIDQQLRAVTSFSQEVRSRGSRPASRVLAAAVVAASADIAVALELAPQTPVIVLDRLRLADSIPLALETAALPAQLLPGLLDHDFSIESLYDVLEQHYHLHLIQAEQIIEAALATADECERLQLSPPTAVLKMQRLTRDQTGRMVEYVRSIYRGDRYTFHSILQPRTTIP